VEAVKNIPAHNRGSALGVYTAFVDLSLGISGPIAGAIVFSLGYPPIFLFAAAMAGSSMALAIALYYWRAEPSNVATGLSRLDSDAGAVAAAREDQSTLPARHAKPEWQRSADSSSPPR
jgi:MFS family permease